jgi:hypothetical protein
MAKRQAAANPVTKPAQKPSITYNVGFMEKHAMKIAILLGVIGLIIRLYRLGFLSLWVDEYMHALAAQNGKFFHGENNGILLTWLNTIITFVFGDSEFWMRFPVALMGAALIPIVYLFGKNISNYKVGLMSAVLVTVSLYLVFWSRVERPYGMVATVYIPLLLSFWLMLERKSDKQNFLTRIGINPKYLLFVFIALILSMLSQMLCFLFFFTAGFYGTFVAIESWLQRKSTPFKLNIYNILFYLNIVVCVLMFTKIGNKAMRPMMEIFLPPNIVTLIMPDLKDISLKLAGKEWLKCFDTYVGVLQMDFKMISLFGWAGFILAWIKNRKTSYFLISSFVVPFLLMSFIFTKTSHAKYISFIYPVFLVSAAYSLYFIAFHLAKSLGKSLNEANRSYAMACTIGFIILVFAVTKRNEIKNLLLTENHGNVVDKALSEIHFVNWRQPCEFIKEKRQPNDVVMATVQAAPRYYLGLDSVVWFRQMKMDGKTQQFVPLENDGRKISASTYEQLVKTFNENPRGWLLADYYFDNSLTDPRAREFVEKNFVFHFDACDDGAVKVFSWDKANPKTYQNAFVIELGKVRGHSASEPFSIKISKASLPPKVTLYFLTQGLDSDNEGAVVINDEKQVPIKSNGKPSKIADNFVTVDASIFKDGENKIQFIYNTDETGEDLTKGFVIYDMDLR